MAKVKVCKTCGTEGDKQNPLCKQGLYIVPYCHDCMNKACKKAGKDPAVIKLRETG
jgi:hypothetical protein